MATIAAPPTISGSPDAVQEVRDQHERERDRAREGRHAGDRQPRPGLHEIALLVVPEEDAVLDRGRQQQHDGEAGEQQGDEEDDTLELVDLVETGRERDRQQECEQHLDARKHDPQLLQELIEVPVQALLLRLVHGASSLPPGCRPCDLG